MTLEVMDYWEDIQRGARAASDTYGRRLSPEDVAQGIVTDILEHPSRYKDIGGKFKYLIIKRAGLRYCAQQSAAFLNYADQYNYSSEELKILLVEYYKEIVVRRVSGEQPKSADDETYDEFRTRVEITNDRTSLFIEGADLERALGLLTGSQRKVLEKKYRDRETLATKYEQNKHSQAIKFLTYHVNERAVKARDKPSSHEGPGARRALSNHASTVAIQHQSDDDEYGPDALRQVERINGYRYPANKPSPYVTNSPWR